MSLDSAVKYSYLNGLLTVFRKELIENMRDRRAVFNSVLLGPLLFPILFIGMSYLTINTEQERAEQIQSIPILK